MQNNQLCFKIVDRIFYQFDPENTQSLSMFKFANSINYLSKKVGGTVCPRCDIDYIFQLIDENGDQKISKR